MSVLPTDAYLNLVATVGFVVFIRASISPNGIFFWYGWFLDWVWLRGTFGKWIAQPLGTCSVCMNGQVHFWIAWYIGCDVWQILWVLGVSYVYLTTYERMIVKNEWTEPIVQLPPKFITVGESTKETV